MPSQTIENFPPEEWAQQMQKLWIPCDKMMPEIMRDVFFFYIRNEVHEKATIGHFDGKGWNICALLQPQKLSLDKKKIDVLFWMPLPGYPIYQKPELVDLK